MTTGKKQLETAGYPGTYAIAQKPANKSRRKNGNFLTVLHGYDKNTLHDISRLNQLQKKREKMTENEYDEIFDMRMEKEHEQTMQRMKQFRLIGEQISKMPATSPKVLEIEVRYLMGIISELEARIKDLESEARRLELLLTRAN